MFRTSDGIEFHRMCVERVGKRVLTDISCADMIARVIAGARMEGSYLEPLADCPTPMEERLRRVAEDESTSAMIFDGEVPAVLGMLTNAHTRIKNREPRSELYRGLTTDGLAFVVASLDGYEQERPVHSPV